MSPAPITIHTGHCLDRLREMPARSVQCCVTSPPYWGLRDYGLPAVLWPTGWRGCHGLEPSPDLYVEHARLIFSEVHRVLSDDGTCWINLGDSYFGSGRGNVKSTKRMGKAKDLVGIPWKVAFALRDDGWYLRKDIIWEKPNVMPESVTDRPTTSHEYLFLLSKSERYHYDAAAIKEPASGTAHARGYGVNPKAITPGRNSRIHVDRDPNHSTARRSRQNASFSAAVKGLVETRNKRSVWTVATAPYRGAHFATYPPALIRPCILAGCPVGGVVLDPFGGSGTTAAVAVELGRRAILIEMNPDYVAMSNARLGQSTMGN